MVQVVKTLNPVLMFIGVPCDRIIRGRRMGWGLCGIESRRSERGDVGFDRVGAGEVWNRESLGQREYVLVLSRPNVMKLENGSITSFESVSVV